MRLFHRSFAGGEVSRSMWARIDDGRYQTGLSYLRNFVGTPTGAVVRRPGLKFICATKNGPTETSVGLPFEYSATDSALIEAGNQYMRFVVAGDPLDHPVAGAWSNVTAYTVGDLASRLGVTYYCILAHTNQQPPNATYWYAQPASGRYEIPTPYIESNLASINYDQSFDVMTLAHDDHLPRELRRYSATEWELTTLDFAPDVAAPASPAATATLGGYISVSIPALSSTFTQGSTPASNTLLAPGEVGYLSASSSGATAVGGIAAGYYVVHTTPSATTFTLKALRGGNIATTGGSSGTGFFQPASASSNDNETYVVTALDVNGRESEASSEVTLWNKLSADGASNALTWTAVTGAERYYVYKKLSGGVFGYIGQTDTNSFTDDNIGPDASRTPPLQDDTLAQSAGDYPAACGHFEQRRWFAATDNNPNGLWGTRTNTESDLSYRIPQQATDRIYVGLSTRKLSIVRHIVPTDHLIILTSSGEFRVTPLNEDAITPTSISVRNEGSVGCSIVRPIVVGNMILFVGARDQHVYEFGIKDGRFRSDDMSVRASHLFDGLSVVCSAQSRQPHQIDWFVTSDGKLLAFNYSPEEGLGGWSVQETDGLIEWVCVVPEGAEDAVYVWVKRTIDGGTVRYIERMESLTPAAAIEDCCYLDSFITYDSTATTSITGLDHLEGEAVYALADGEEVGPFTVSSGAITLTTAASVVQVGLKYTSTLRTLPIAAQLDGYGKGRLWNVGKITFQVEDSGLFQARPYNDDITEAQRATAQDVYLVRGDGAEIMPDDELTADANVYVDCEGGWQQNGQVEVSTSSLLPLKIVSMCIEAEPGEG